ncbi:CDP-diacylglycerol--glycerol-3-phosphate 3-phosphatidyltransferase [Ectothiorhodospira magna]|uniref:CDP-diacylglycerol--glycerol-3-phosphate 3-phosphatidyltransferase n=1 Tax=Ectothiorhodospira magna TaxID=867345 RepID=A0A1H9CW67_9GAMM|nr:CDP-diacylglycerol--glycerol-3-phosphate 3-phosphatidyltransferase [Ectothiorhodospira magna]SEQ05414.1 CDP-diacylglycerol--glycerol-3-phosphate 3-phosphatidyltransferase [Ectothiorhodospira magna]
MTFSIPNLLTWMRIALIPLIVVVYYYPHPLSGPVSAMIFALAAITDWLDGYLARRLGQTSSFGAFLDPVADKLMVATALVLLVDNPGGMLLAVAAAIIIGREIAISALREWMAELGQRGKVAVSWIGKLKTTAQMVAIFLLLHAQPILGLPTFTLGLILLYVAAALTLWSMFHYLRAALSIAEN